MGINRNIVECKYKTIISEKRPCKVLIETLWNVNKTDGTEIYKKQLQVLIETLWNVNEEYLEIIRNKLAY